MYIVKHIKNYVVIASEILKLQQIKKQHYGFDY